LTCPNTRRAETLHALNPDFLLVIGGDGTLLDATSQVGRSGIPLIGLNTGRLGFLANITRDEAPTALKRILQGEYRIEERYTLQAATDGPELLDPNFALNEIAVSRQGHHQHDFGARAPRRAVFEHLLWEKVPLLFA